MQQSEEATTGGSPPFTKTWEAGIAQEIQQRIINESRKDKTKPFLVGIVGIPGSGKSTSSSILSEVLSDNGTTNIVMPMDGYHYPLSTLHATSCCSYAVDNAEDMIYRRGAPDTFDSKTLKIDLKRIKSGEEADIYIPGFDHAKGDPELDVYKFARAAHSVVICEGLYLLHQSDGWDGIDDSFDLTVFIDANVDVCVDRLKVRNLCIPGYTPKEIEVRCDAVDRVNAMTVLKSRERADFVVDSVAL